jgi:hypothetical protein
MIHELDRLAQKISLERLLFGCTSIFTNSFSPWQVPQGDGFSFSTPEDWLKGITNESKKLICPFS